MANRIFSGLKRLYIFYGGKALLGLAVIGLTIVAIGIFYVRTVNFQTGFKHVGYARAQVLSAAATHSDSSPPSLLMRIAIQDGTRFQISGGTAWINTLNGDIICVELKQHEGGDNRRASPVPEQECERLPVWQP